MNPLLDHYGFRHPPFGRAPGADSLLRHRGFEEALKRLLFTAQLDSIAILVSEAGCGKSLLLGVLAQDLQQTGWAVHYIAHTTTGPFGLVNVLARKTGVAPRRSRAETALLIGDHLLQDERKHLLLIDEAHALPDATLEDIRLLTVADYDRQSPFVLVLAGQSALEDRLAEPVHYALDQRVTTVARLAPLAAEETREYVQRRLEAAGAKRQAFDDDAHEPLFEVSSGVPRQINGYATSALIVAAARGRRRVTAQDVHDARLDRGRV